MSKFVVSETKLIQKLIARGYNINDNLGKYLIKYYEEKTNIYLNGYLSDLDLEKEDIDIINSTVLFFKNLEKYDINYVYYVLIFIDLNIQELKNIYRYILIKWSQIKNNDNVNEGINLDINFKYNIKEIKNINNKISIKEKIIESFFDFINNTYKGENNIYLLFLINTMHQYLCPI